MESSIFIVLFTAMAVTGAVFGVFGVHYLTGFIVGLSLIIAIGAQNAFVLKQGLKKQHVFLVCTICALSDAILIALGVSGFGAVVERFPLVEKIARYGGAIFLVFYAIISFHSAYKNQHRLIAEGSDTDSAVKVALICLGFTWLNPHVYLDTLILLGAVSTQYVDVQGFALGAISASFVFFFSLGYGARILIPVFQNPRAWQILEFFVGVLMLSIAISLII